MIESKTTKPARNGRSSLNAMRGDELMEHAAVALMEKNYPRLVSLSRAIINRNDYRLAEPLFFMSKELAKTQDSKFLRQARTGLFVASRMSSFLNTKAGKELAIKSLPSILDLAVLMKNKGILNAQYVLYDCESVDKIRESYEIRDNNLEKRIEELWASAKKELLYPNGVLSPTAYAENLIKSIDRMGLCISWDDIRGVDSFIDSKMIDAEKLPVSERLEIYSRLYKEVYSTYHPAHFSGRTDRTHLDTLLAAIFEHIGEIPVSERIDICNRMISNTYFQTAQDRHRFLDAIINEVDNLPLSSETYVNTLRFLKTFTPYSNCDDADAIIKEARGKFEALNLLPENVAVRNAAASFVKWFGGEKPSPGK